MNVRTSDVHPLVPCALLANFAYTAFLGVDGLKAVVAPPELKHRPDATSVAKNSVMIERKNMIDNRLNITQQPTISACSVAKNSVMIEQKKMIDNVLRINPDNITQQLRTLVMSVVNISNASLADFKKQYGTWDIATALVVYEEKLCENTDIFTLAIICCSLALLIQSKRRHTEIEKMNELYAKSQAAIYRSVRYLKILQEQHTLHEDKVKLQETVVNTLQTTLAANDNCSMWQKSQESHDRNNEQILSLLKIHREKLEVSEYYNEQKKQQILNMIVVDVIKADSPSSLFQDGRSMFP